MIQETHIFRQRNRESLLSFFFLSRLADDKNVSRERIRADNFPGDSEKERSSIVLYRETRTSGYNADGSSSILTTAVGDKNDGRKETIKERIAKKKQAGIREKRTARGALLGASAKREKQGARKCPQIITKIIHQRISHFLFTLPLSLFHLLNLRLLFLSVLDIFSRNRDSPGKRTTEMRVTETSWE